MRYWQNYTLIDLDIMRYWQNDIFIYSQNYKDIMRYSQNYTVKYVIYSDIQI
jgi:hypothetical protein